MNLRAGKCSWAVFLAVGLAGSLSAADSVFVDQAFNGRWQSPFEVFVFQQIAEADGLRLINSIGDPQFAEKNCPGPSEKREFYSASTPDVLLYGCTNGNALVGRFTDKNNNGQADSGSFASDPIPKPLSATPAFDVTINSKVNGTIRMRLAYLSGGLATPLAYVTDDVAILKATPGSGASLLGSDPLPPFQVQVSFQVKTVPQASVVLVLADKIGVLGSSEAVTGSKADGLRQSPLTIPAPAPTRPLQGPLTLIAELRSPSGAVLAASKPANYSIYVPPSGVSVSPDFLHFVAFPGSLLQSGRQSATIRITGLSPGARLALSPQFSGGGTNWMTTSLSKAAGQLQVVVDDANLAPGVYWGSIGLQWDGGERSIAVAFRVYPTRSGYGWMSVVPNTLLFESALTGTNDVRNVKVYDQHNHLAVPGFVVTRELPYLVQTGPAYSPPDWPYASPADYFSVKLSEALRQVGTKSTVLKVSAPGHYAEPVLVTTRIRSDAEPQVPVLSRSSVWLNPYLRSNIVRVDCSFRGGEGYVQPVEVTAVTSDGRDWLRVSGGTYCSTAFTGSVTISLDPSVLPHTGYDTFKGYVSFRIGDVVRTVRVDAEDDPMAPTASSGAARSADAGCTPAAARVLETMLPGGFSVPAGAPVALSAQLRDNCGHALTDGSVTASFSNGDRPVQLQRGADGLFSATWQPLNPLLRTVVTLTANSGELKVDTLEIEGEITPEVTPAPSLETGGIVNSLAPVLGSPASPGMLVQVTGHNLAAEEAAAEGASLPLSFKGVEVRIGDVPSPIVSVSNSRLIVQVPAELEADRSYPVLVSTNGNYAAPREVYLVAAQPGVATSPDGRLIAEHAGGELITAERPAKPGEEIVLHLVGMGATSPAVPSGTAAPETPAATLIQPRVTIAGEPAEVLFSGLTPGKVGFYHIRLLVPSTASEGELAVVISQDGAKANSATLPVGR